MYFSAHYQVLTQQTRQYFAAAGLLYPDHQIAKAQILIDCKNADSHKINETGKIWNKSAAFRDCKPRRFWHSQFTKT
jgi:hypothetical protein